MIAVQVQMGMNKCSVERAAGAPFPQLAHIHGTAQ